MAYPRAVSLNSIANQIKEIETEPHMGDVIYTNMDILARCIDSIFRHNGHPEWVADVYDVHRKPIFKPTEYEQIHSAFSVFFPVLFPFFGKPVPVDQSGGDNIDPRNAEIKRLQNEVNSLRQTARPSRSDAQGIDALYRKVIDMFRSMNSSVINFASTYGILKLEKSFDDQTDPRPFLPLAGVPGLQVIANTPVPIRVIVLFLYTCLDVARVFISISPDDNPFIRKVLSIIMAIVDILRGDVKKAILSFSSFFNKDYAIISVIGKVVLDIAGFISPYLQYRMTYGVLDVMKSMLAGVLLETFQTFAPYPLRAPVIEQIAVLREIAESNKKIIEERIENPEQQELYASFLIPSFEQIQTLQSIFINDELLCDPRVIHAVDTIVGSPEQPNMILKIVFELLGVPVDREERVRKCGIGNTTATFSEAIAKSAVEQIASLHTSDQVAQQSSPLPQSSDPASHTSDQVA
jgi:hypothetical protein